MTKSSKRERERQRGQILTTPQEADQNDAGVKNRCKGLLNRRQEEVRIMNVANQLNYSEKKRVAVDSDRKRKKERKHRISACSRLV